MSALRYWTKFLKAWQKGAGTAAVAAAHAALPVFREVPVFLLHLPRMRTWFRDAGRDGARQAGAAAGPGGVASLLKGQRAARDRGRCRPPRGSGRGLRRGAASSRLPLSRSPAPGAAPAAARGQLRSKGSGRPRRRLLGSG